MNKPSRPVNLTASALLKTGAGVLRGLFCSVASGSPTISFVDGIVDNDDVANAATGVLTVSGAIVPGAHATNTLTSDATNVADGETVVIGAITYRFKDTMLAAYDVQIGADAETSLANLKKAINASGTPGTHYFAGTLAHPLVVAGTATATTLQVWARLIGTASNTLATTETSGHLSWADSTLGGGTGASDPGVSTAAATVTIGTRTYTFVNELTETTGATAVPDQVLWGGDTATALDNLKVAINAGATAGTNYSTGTTAHAVVTATTNTDTAQTIQAIVAGASANSTDTTETLTNGSWGAATMTGGLDATVMLIEAFTAVAGETYMFPDVAFNTGCYIRVSGTFEGTAFLN